MTNHGGELEFSLDLEEDLEFSAWLNMTAHAEDVEAEDSVDRLNDSHQPRDSLKPHSSVVDMSHDESGSDLISPSDETPVLLQGFSNERHGNLTATNPPGTDTAGGREGSGSPMAVSPKSGSPLLDALSASVKTLKQFGTCWSCKFFGQKCDPQNPCKACRVLEAKTPWQAVGCRRGSLSEQIQPLQLCPNALVDPEQDRIPTTAQQKLCNQLLRTAEGILELAEENLASVLAEPQASIQKAVLQALCPLPRNPRSASGRSTPEMNRAIIESRPILRIIWGLLNNSSAKSIMNIGSVDELADLINAAETYEKECDDSSLISTSIKCLLHCVETLRLHDTGLLTPYPHKTCFRGKCQLSCLNDLASSMNTYMEMFSRTVPRKENAASNRRWWLSCFYSLCIQAYIRRGLLAIEAQLTSPTGQGDTSASKSTQYDYMHMIVQLFAAASNGFDPLSSDWTIEEPPEQLRSDLELLKYYRHAQKAVQSRRWKELDIHNSFSYLDQKFDIAQRATPVPQNGDDAASYRSVFSLDDDIGKGSGTKRRANSPLADDGPYYHSTWAGKEQLPGSAPPLPPPRHLPASQPSATSPHPARWRAHSSSESLFGSGHMSRNTSPAGWPPFRPAPSPATSGGLSRNVSNDSLSALPDNLNGWSLASTGSMSPGSGLGAGESYLTRDSTPSVPRHFSLGASPHAPPSRRTSSSGYQPYFNSQALIGQSMAQNQQQGVSARQGLGSNSSDEDLTIAASRRKAMNRAAQRAFRERKERHLQALEAKLVSLEARQLETAMENERLKREKQKMSAENETLRATATNLTQGDVTPSKAADASSASTAVEKPGHFSQPSTLETSGLTVQEAIMGNHRPKQPKKYHTFEEQTTHEAERQYGCSFCEKRFKNKNEADRHQNTLHLRRYYWSCGTQLGFEKAFFDSPERPGQVDRCGYCGRDFSRSGLVQMEDEPPLLVAPPGYATDEDWAERIAHLQVAHKFGECNTGKKFFRADNFRQHVKHSHGGIMGKWTTFLETACMLECQKDTTVP